MHFLYHNVLFFMLVPTILLMFLITTSKDNFQKYFSGDILVKLSIKNKFMGKTTRNILLFISLILMIIALSRPVANEKEQSFKQEVAGIVVAIDVSKSMLANDIYPNRLALAKRKLLDIIKLSKKSALAIILFAKESFVLSPVTQDFNSLKILVENLNLGLNFDNGSNIFSTLETSNKLLKNYENKNLILLTDGGNAKNYKDEIKYAKENNINVYTVALATKKPSAIKLQNGNLLTKKDGSIVTVKLNEAIKNLSLETNGGYITYSLTNSDLKQILNDIDKKSKKKELESKKFKTYTELFYYPLCLALLILLIAFSSLPKFMSKGFSTNVLLLFILFFSNNVKALDFNFQSIKKANNYYKKGDYKKATKEYSKVENTPQSKYDLANSLYKEGEYKKALKKYTEVITSNHDLEYRKLHNMGNTYVRLNNLQSAKNMYEKALKIKNNKETKENLEKVLEALKKKKNKQQKKKNEEENKQENKQEKKKNEEKNKEKNKKIEENKENKSKREEEKKKENKQIQKNQISNLEERKWLKQLENKKMPILLERMETKKKDSSANPW